MKWADQAVLNQLCLIYAFLDDKIAFGDIYKVVTSVLESMGPEDDFTLDNLLAIDRWAREKATSLMV